MKHLSTLMAMFLLVGCQTTQSAEVDTKPPPEKPKLELKEEKELKNPFKDSEIIAGTIVTSSKPVICGRIDVILNNMKAKFGEIPVMVGKVSVQNTGEDTKDIMNTILILPPEILVENYKTNEKRNYSRDIWAVGVIIHLILLKRLVVQVILVLR